MKFLKVHCHRNRDHRFHRDLSDAVAKRRALGKTADTARVRRIIQSKKAQDAGAAQAKIMNRVCREVARKRGAATSF